METLAKFGEFLKSQRETKGIRLEEIASITKIHIKSLEHLEAGRMSELPPEPFIRGFLIAYSKYVGINPKVVLEKYYADMGQSPAEAPIPTPALSERKLVREPKQPVRESTPVRAPKSVSDVMEHGRPMASGPFFAAAAVIGVLLIGGGVIYVGKRGAPMPVKAPDLSAIAAPGAASDGVTAPAAAPLAQETTKVAPVTAEAPVPPAAPAEVTPAPTPNVPPLISASNPPPAPAPVEEVRYPAATAPSSPPAAVEAAPVAAPVVAAVAPPAPTPTPAPAQPVAAAAPGPSNELVAAATAPPVKKPEHEVVIEGLHRSWMKVVIDDQRPFQTFLNEGERKTLTANEKIKVVLGNSAGAKIYHNGALDEGVKYDGTIRFYRYPDKAKFPQDHSPRRTAHHATEPEQADSAVPTDPQ